MKDLQEKEKILRDYKKKSEDILVHMLKILGQAQKKVDSEAYRTIIKKLEK